MALCAAVQCIFVVVAAQSLRKSGARVSEMCQRFDVEIKPTLEDLRKGAANLRAISESGREQALRAESLVSSALGSIETALESARSLIVQPLASLTEFSAFWSGLRRGLETYRKAEPMERAPRSTRHRPAEDSDEHMFIG
jgi:hypothetical protein